MPWTKRTLILLCVIVVGSLGRSASSDGDVSLESAVEVAEATPLSQVVLERRAHFFAKGPDGAIAVDSGIYRVQALDDGQLRLEREDGFEAVIPAERGEHEEDLAEPVAVIESTDEDELHIVLFRPDGTVLDAAGSHSGVLSRGTRRMQRRPYVLRAYRVNATRPTTRLRRKVIGVSPSRVRAAELARVVVRLNSAQVAHVRKGGGKPVSVKLTSAQQAPLRRIAPKYGATNIAVRTAQISRTSGVVVSVSNALSTNPLATVESTDYMAEINALLEALQAKYEDLRDRVEHHRDLRRLADAARARFEVDPSSANQAAWNALEAQCDAALNSIDALQAEIHDLENNQLPAARAAAAAAAAKARANAG